MKGNNIVFKTLDGYNINCRYVEHEAFNLEDPLCGALHKTYLAYSPNYGYSSVCNLRRGIEVFLDFVTFYNSQNHEALQIKTVLDLNLERLNEYFRYLKKRKINQSYIEALRNAFSFMVKEFEDFPVITFPVIKNRQTKPNEPLEETTVDELEKRLKLEIDSIREKIEFRKEVEAVKPYTYEEIIENVDPSCTKRNIYLWYRYMLKKHDGKRANISIKRKLVAGKNVDPKLKALLKEDKVATIFHELYEKEAESIIGDECSNPFEIVGIRAWKPNYKRVLKTFLVNGYPFDMDPEEVKTINTDNLKPFEKCTDVVRVLFHRFTTARYISKHRATNAIPVVELDTLLNMYFPTQMDVASIMLMMQLQTGWNKETVIDLDRTDFLQPLSGVIDETQQLLFSTKYRSQNTNLPFHKPKDMFAISSTKDKYSAYNLVILAEELALPLLGKELDNTPMRVQRTNDLFFCKNDFGDWTETGRFGTLSNVKVSIRGVKDFLAKYEIVDKGKRLRNSGDLVKRLRPTWVYLKKKSNPMGMIQMQMGHNSRDTTDIHYDNSPMARVDRKKRLRVVLNKLMAMVKERRFKGLLPNERPGKIKDDNLVIFTIPTHERPLWACKNQCSPDWLGHEKYLDEGEKCHYINHCLSCSQVQLFNDSLVYLIDRLDYLEMMERSQPSLEFNQLYGSEIEVIRWIIDNWEDKEALKKANRYVRRNKPLLPKDLASLVPLFERVSL